MGNSHSADGRAPVCTFFSSKSWIEGEAVRQLETVAGMPGVSAVAGLPDLHPGKYGPVGCAILADRVHPALVGSDIGCGMALVQLDVPARRLRADKAAERLRVLGQPWDGDGAGRVRALGLAPTSCDASLGSIGGGNHFCELQTIEDILAPEPARAAGLDPEAAYLLVHSGSRGLGASILQDVLAGGLVALDPSSPEGTAYLSRHEHAVAWARLNRAVIAERAATALRAEARVVADLAHNMAESTPAGILHRKGAAPSDRGLVPVPGSRDTLSFLVDPIETGRTPALASLAHGAGRKYDRGSMHGRVGTKRSDIDRLSRNRFGGMVLCENRDMLIEEAPDAYKAVERVIEDLATFGLARAVASFRPLVTFKSTVERTRQDGRPNVRREPVRHRPPGTLDKRDREDWR